MKELEMHNGEVYDANTGKRLDLRPGEYRCIQCGDIHHIDEGDCPEL